jgi:hypothetical protein
MIRLRHIAGSVTAVGALVLAFCVPSFAQNEGFETGDFDHWSTFGTTTVLTSFAGFGPTEGNFLAQLEAGAQPGVLTEAFLGVPLGSLDPISTDQVTGGSSLKRTIDATAGQTFAFDYNFIGNDAVPFNDFAFFSIVPQGGTANPLLLTNVANTGDNASSGWLTQTFTFANPGTYTLGIGVFNARDNLFNSSLLVDNLRVVSTPPPPVIPEPGAVATGGIMAAALSLGMIRGRRKRTV